ncbi:hypothetical protein ACIQXF_07035 [Lysinibacillus sp. NPDC097231]|uniref:hypothetical protein n=1 Tax=Lysinibacillus sp. NPDC097231 TaxID=3364142 RepID=UPI0038215E3F
MLSKLSIIMSIMGVLFFSSAYIFTKSFELLMMIGLATLFISLLSSFSAMFKGEQGKTKLLPVAAFFILSFTLIWTEPFQIVRLLTWFKNII